jgi:16S rRNA (adenine1518-N6/adenine1519-N6)-dimethyltransferase
MSDDVPAFTEAPARKSLGQHFLFDPNILKRAALAAGPVEGRTVIEVGPGPGGLTRAILDQGAAKLIVVEADARFASALDAWPEAKTGRLQIIHKDARKVGWEKTLTENGAALPAMIIANLPYNVGTPLLINWLKAGAWRGEMALMFQKEVALRICAKPDTDAYGRLAVLSQAVTEPRIAFTLPAGAFRPPPKVESAVVTFMPLPEDKKFPHLNALEEVTGAAFGQRRKMLRAALKPLARRHGKDAAEWLAGLGLDPAQRAETLPIECFFRMAASLVSTRG